MKLKIKLMVAISTLAFSNLVWSGDIERGENDRYSPEYYQSHFNYKTKMFEEGSNLAGVGYLDDDKNLGIEIFKIASLKSKPSESMMDFVYRGGEIMADYTKNTNFESCTRICKNQQSGQYGMIISTSKSHFFCALNSLCPDNMSEYGFSIHTHPKGRRYKLNKADLAFMRARSVDKYLGSPLKIGMSVESGNMNKFSEHDYNSGPGFLIANDFIYFQNNRQVKYKKIGPLK